MTKELEALYVIGNLEAFTGVCEEERTSMINELPEYKIIESALNDYERLKEILSISARSAVKINDKYKALNVIKKKKWLVEDILNAFIENKDEYDLLKEMLL